MKHTITIDGQQRDLDIRPMDEGFIVYRKMYQPPLTRENIDFSDIGPDDRYEEIKRFQKDRRKEIIEPFFRMQIRAIGSCMILAWEEQGVIGKMHFTTKEMYEAFHHAGCHYCVGEESMPKMIKSLDDRQLGRLLASPSRTLRILCFNIGHADTRYHGQGIAKAMIECLKSSARQWGWQRIEARSCPDITPTSVVWAWTLRRGVMQRLGFHIAETKPASPKEAQERLRIIQDLSVGKKDHPDWDKWYPWYFDHFSRLAADPSWQDEYDKDYLMACDL